MNFQTICCILNMIGLIILTIFMIILFNKEKLSNNKTFNKNEHFGSSPQSSSISWPPTSDAEVLLSDTYGNLSKDNGTLSGYIAQEIKAASSSLASSLEELITTNSQNITTIMSNSNWNKFIPFLNDEAEFLAAGTGTLWRTCCHDPTTNNTSPSTINMTITYKSAPEPT